MGTALKLSSFLPHKFLSLSLDSEHILGVWTKQLKKNIYSTPCNRGKSQLCAHARFKGGGGKEDVILQVKEQLKITEDCNSQVMISPPAHHTSKHLQGRNDCILLFSGTVLLCSAQGPCYSNGNIYMMQKHSFSPNTSWGKHTLSEQQSNPGGLWLPKRNMPEMPVLTVSRQDVVLLSSQQLLREVLLCIFLD